jgi:polysaccharide biosynthesis transport protein
MNQELNSPNEPRQPSGNSDALVVQAAGGAPRAGAASNAGTPKVNSLTATSILKALRRRQTLALGVAILAVLISAPIAWFAVPATKFKAQARLQLVAQAPKMLFRTVETDTSGEDYRRYQLTQLTLVKSQLVLNAALLDKNVSRFRMIREQIDPIAWLQENVKAEFVTGSEVMEIALTGDDPVEIAGVVNAIKKAYMDEVVNVDTKRRADRHSKLKSIKDNYAEILKERRERLRKSAEAVGSDDHDTLALKQQYAIQNANSLMTELMRIQLEKRRLEAQLKTRRPQDEEIAEPTAPAGISEADIEDMIDKSPAVAKLESQLASDEAKYNAFMGALKQTSRKLGDPQARKLLNDVYADRAQVKKKRAEMRPLAIQELQAQHKDEQVKAGNDEAKVLAALTEFETSLKEELKNLQEQSKTLNTKTLDLTQLQDEVTQLNGTSSQVSNEVEALNVELQAPPRVRTIEDAVPPMTRDERKRTATILLIVIGSFFAGLFGIAFLELQTQKVDAVDAVPAELGLPVVGTLPMVRTKPTKSGTLARVPTPKDRYWNNVLLESVDAARTMLVHTARMESHRVVMITSAVGSEGKTSLSSHLATSLARSGLKTLLVDADLRSPSVHRLFDLPVASGLSEVLRGEVELSAAIADTEVGELKVLAAGCCDRRTIRLLAQGYLGAVFGTLRDQFDFVIVDTSPILPVADASLVAQEADAVLFSIFSDVSRKAKVCAALQRLESLGVRVLGAVVTGSVDMTYGSYHSDSYYASLPESATVDSQPDLNS